MSKDNDNNVSDNGYRKTIYVSREYVGVIGRLDSIAKKLNVSIVRLFFDDKYKNREEVIKELKKAKMIALSKEVFERINNRLRDSLIFDKCNYSTLKLEERGMHKKDILNNFKDELLLVKNSVDLSNNSKRILTKKIKAQLKNFRDTSFSMLARRRRLFEKDVIQNKNNNTVKRLGLIDE